ncbi:MAG: chemoreceptor glutamine deamidase CheD [Burkholderiaceae bacterium]
MRDDARLAQLKTRRRGDGEASFVFYDHGFATEAVKVLPGEYFVWNEDIVIQTVLGSCVAACLCDRGAGIGGMNHFMLPGGSDDSARYGGYAMELLINELMKRGARRASLEAKVFGGGAVISGMASINVGEQNVKFVQQFLATERIPIVSRDVLGVYPRRVAFFPASGKAMVKKLTSGMAEPVARDEAAYRGRVEQRSAAAGSVELF